MIMKMMLTNIDQKTISSYGLFKQITNLRIYYMYTHTHKNQTKIRKKEEEVIKLIIIKYVHKYINMLMCYVYINIHLLTDS